MTAVAPRALQTTPRRFSPPSFPISRITGTPRPSDGRSPVRHRALAPADDRTARAPPSRHAYACGGVIGDQLDHGAVSCSAYASSRTRGIVRRTAKAKAISRWWRPLRRHFSADDARHQLDIAIDWGRYAELFEYGSERGELVLEPAAPHPVTAAFRPLRASPLVRPRVASAALRPGCGASVPLGFACDRRCRASNSATTTAAANAKITTTPVLGEVLLPSGHPAVADRCSGLRDVGQQVHGRGRGVHATHPV